MEALSSIYEQYKLTLGTVSNVLELGSFKLAQ